MKLFYMMLYILQVYIVMEQQRAGRHVALDDIRLMNLSNVSDHDQCEYINE